MLKEGGSTRVFYPPVTIPCAPVQNTMFRGTAHSVLKVQAAEYQTWKGSQKKCVTQCVKIPNMHATLTVVFVKTPVI